MIQSIYLNHLPPLLISLTKVANNTDQRIISIPGKRNTTLLHFLVQLPCSINLMETSHSLQQCAICSWAWWVQWTEHILCQTIIPWTIMQIICLKHFTFNIKTNAHFQSLTVIASKTWSWSWYTAVRGNLLLQHYNKYIYKSPWTYVSLKTTAFLARDMPWEFEFSGMLRCIVGYTVPVLKNCENESTMTLQNVMNHLPNNTV